MGVTYIFMANAVDMNIGQEAIFFNEQYIGAAPAILRAGKIKQNKT